MRKSESSNGSSQKVASPPVGDAPPKLTEVEELKVTKLNLLQGMVELRRENASLHSKVGNLQASLAQFEQESWQREIQSNSKWLIAKGCIQAQPAMPANGLSTPPEERETPL